MRLTKEMQLVNFLDMGIKTITQEPAYISKEIDEEEKKDPAVLRSISDVLGIPDEMGVDMYVLTTKSQKYGAKAICYSGVIKRLAEMFHFDFWMIPSSIHEVIIVPGDVYYDGNEMVSVIREVNATMLAPQDRLSDNAYHFRDGKFEIVKGDE